MEIYRNAAISHKNGISIHELITGAPVLDIPSTSSYMYGVLFMNSPEYINNGNVRSDCLISYGFSGAYTSFWYETAFGESTLSSANTEISDAWIPLKNTAGYNLNYGEVAHTNKTVEWKQYNTTNHIWESRKILYSDWFATTNQFNMPVSAQGGFDSFALIVTQGFGIPGELWYGNINDTKGVKVGEVGTWPKKIRGVNGLCFVTNYQSNDLTVIKWPVSSIKPEILYNVPVGNGPVGIDLGIDKDSTIHVLTTGFNDNTYTITQIAPDGSLKSNKTTTLTNCNNPGHASFITKNKILITSYTDSTYVIVTRETN
ncbi:hypothetical protein HY745_08920 [Candidatus Desantisbacteria bacterium]|nr:hypothetical protein [Candidatus Desantisbacteria bacterium]